MSEKPPLFSRQQRQAIFVLGIILLLVFVVAFGFSLRQIYHSVNDICRIAQEQHPGDPIDALLALIESDSASFKNKNRAIWALGQIGSKRALPLLHELDTEKIQSKPYDSSAYIVQYTVEKAISQIEGNISLTRWMYGKLR